MDAAGSSEEPGENKNRLESFLSATELSQIPEDVAKKIEKKFEEEAAIEKIYQLKSEELKSKLKIAEGNIVGKGEQVVYLSKHLDQATLKITTLEKELVCLRSARDSAIEEDNNKTYALETKTAELERLRSIYTEAKIELEEANNEKSKAIALTDCLQSKVHVTQTEKNKLEKERDFLNSQIACLNNEIDKLFKDLQTRSFYNTQELLTLTTEFDKKVEELKSAEDTIVNLKELINTLNKTVDTLNAKLKEKELDTAIIDSYQKELDAKERAACLYKNMHEDAQNKLNKMEEASTQLKQSLKEAKEKYDDLDMKHKQLEIDHETLLEKKNEIIESLKTEVENASKQNLDNVLSKLSPTAADMIKILNLKPEMSLTQLYFQLVKATEGFTKEKEENRRLNSNISSLTQELQKKESLLQIQIARYEETLEGNRLLTETINSQVREINNLKEANIELSTQSNNYNIENNRLKRDLRDLGNQVCFLLNKIEEYRSESSPKSDLPHNEKIPNIGSKALITFSDIQELQINNQKLLCMVRDLSEKQEKFESYKEQVKVTDGYIKEIEKLKKDNEDMTKCHTIMLRNVIRQRDTFEKLYNEHKENKQQEPTQIIKVPTEQVAHEDQLQKELDDLKEEYNVYKEERANNENMLIEQMDSMRHEITKLTGINCKITVTSEYNNERLKTCLSTIETYKSQIMSLEKKNKIYDNIIGKHEISLQSLRNELLSSKKYIATVDVKNENLNSEIKLLKNIQARIENENAFLNRERLSQANLLVNFESIKASIERVGCENQAILKTKLDETTHECSALKLRLQEEQDKSRELASHLERRTNTAETRLLEEKKTADAMRLEISQLRQDIAELQTKLNLKDSDTTVDLLKKNEDLKNVISKNESDIKDLEELLNRAKQELLNGAKQAEQEIKVLSEEYNIYKNKSEEKVTQFIKEIKDLNDHCSKLELEISKNENFNNFESTIELLSKEQLKDELEKTRRELALVRSESTKLAEIQQATEDKYNHEIILHSTDIQALSKIKEELFEIQAKVKEMAVIRDSAVMTLQTEKSCWDKKEMLLRSENDQLLFRLEHLNTQNSLLHNQIQSLNTQSSSLTDNMQDSANTSVGNAEEVKSSDQLLQIISLLKQEKDIAVAKCDISKAEALRFKLQLENTKSKLDNMVLESNRKHSETNMPAMNTQPDIRKIIETHNALTDSNRLLRLERDSLLARVEAVTVSIKDLQEKVLALEQKVSALTTENETLQAENKILKNDSTNQLLHLQEKVSALTSANETLQAENNLVKDSTNWKPRINSEDWKRLQNEREGLVKILTKERNEKSKIEESYSSLSHEHTALLESVTKLNELIGNMEAELVASRENNTKINMDLINKDAVLLDTRDKQLKIKNIAIKYKTLYENLNKTIEDEKKKTQSQSAAIDAANVEIGLKIGQLQSKLECEKSSSVSLKTELGPILEQAKSQLFLLAKANNALKLELSETRGKIQTLQQSNVDEQDARLAVIKSLYENRLTRLEGENKQTLAEKDRELESLLQKVTLLQRQISSQTAITKLEANTTSGSSTANVNPTAGRAESRASGTTEQTSGSAQSTEDTAASPAQEIVSAEAEPLDRFSIYDICASSSSHSPEVVPSNYPRTRVRSAKSARTSGSTPASKAGGSAAQSSSGASTSQASRPTKRFQVPRDPADAKRPKHAQGNKRSSEVDNQTPSSSRDANKDEADEKDKESKAQSAEAGTSGTKEREEETFTPPLPQVDVSGDNDENVQIYENEPHFGDADDGSDSIAPTSQESGDNSYDGFQSASFTSGSDDNTQGEAGENLSNAMPPPNTPAVSGTASGAVSGAASGAVSGAAVQIVRGDAHPPLIRPPQGAPYRNHQREDNREAQERREAPLRPRIINWMPNRYIRPDFPRGQSGRRNRNRGRFFRRPF